MDDYLWIQRVLQVPGCTRMKSGARRRERRRPGLAGGFCDGTCQCCHEQRGLGLFAGQAAPALLHAGASPTNLELPDRSHFQEGITGNPTTLPSLEHAPHRKVIQRHSILQVKKKSERQPPNELSDVALLCLPQCLRSFRAVADTHRLDPPSFGCN